MISIILKNDFPGYCSELSCPTLTEHQRECLICLLPWLGKTAGETDGRLTTHSYESPIYDRRS